MHALKEVCSSAILFFEVIGIALIGAIGYRNVSADEWDDHMNLPPPPPGSWPLHLPQDSAVRGVRMPSSQNVHLPQ